MSSRPSDHKFTRELRGQIQEIWHWNLRIRGSELHCVRILQILDSALLTQINCDIKKL